MLRLVLWIAAAGFVVALGSSALSASSASNTTPQSTVHTEVRVVVPNDLTPPECAGITVTAVVSGSGTVTGTAANELITGSAGVDDISGLGGDDCIVAGAGNDTVNGGFGNDVIRGDDGDDSLSGNAGDDVLYGGGGTDTCDGGGDAGDTFPDGSCETIIP